MKLAALILVASSLPALSSTASQSDWSGGPGFPGPVASWGTVFQKGSASDWSGQPGFLSLEAFGPHAISQDFESANSLCGADFDGDGDLDILGASFSGDEVVWWENSGGHGGAWTEHALASGFDGAFCVSPGDIDGDGDIDATGAAYLGDEIVWWENVDGAGGSWVAHQVSDSFNGARSTCASDIDEDGDLDILGAAYGSDEVYWWENGNGAGTAWSLHQVAISCNGVRTAVVADMDGDGDPDILCAAYLQNSVLWFENTDGAGSAWTERMISDSFGHASAASAHDLDGDGDIDAIAASESGDCVSWWENDGTGSRWTGHAICTGFTRAQNAEAGDLDGDGDMDITMAAYGADKVAWCENVDGAGISWIQHTLDDSFDGARWVDCNDVDGDGRPEIAAASLLGDGLSWWDAISFQPAGWIESSVLDTGVNPVWGTLLWSASIPTGTIVTLQVRSSPDPADMGEWSDSISAPCSLHGVLGDGERYLQYRINLLSSMIEATPVLQDLTVSWTPEGAGGGEPESLLLLPVSPNPSSGGASVARFATPGAALVTLSVFDMSGRCVVSRDVDAAGAGVHTEALPFLPAGIYLLRMTSGDFAGSSLFAVLD